MLSILIPAYNYDVFPLVLELEKQCLECNIDFEILCQDDASYQFLNENQKINSLKNCRFKALEKNIGRSANRNLLVNDTKFENLLFLDADTIPIHNHFINNYIAQIYKNEKVVFGGIEYQKEKPTNEQLLRWVYGKKRESLPVEKRNIYPNETALTSNLLIKKEVFISNPFDESIIKYGYEDLVFLSNLKKKGILVKHIDNPTYHLGLETSQQFLDKTKIALENLILISKTTPLDDSESKILKTFIILKTLHLTSFVSYLFKKGERKLEYNLVSQKPSLLLFDLYKLGYFCTKSSS